jgi:hypothetical protein
MKSSFWSDPSLEPKRSYRWLLYMGGIPTWMVKKTKKPEAEIGEIEVAYLNHSFFFPGRLKWSTIDITLLDPVTPDASATMRDILHSSGYHFPKDPNDTTTISKKNATRALGNCKLVQIDADGNEIETNLLRNAWLKKVTYGELDYSDDKMVEITLTIRYDYAEMTTTNSGVAPADQ